MDLFLKKFILLLILLAFCLAPAHAQTDENGFLLEAEIEDILDDDMAEASPAALDSLKLSELKKAAEAGDKNAQLLTGDRYYYGKGGAPRDRYQAFNWYAKAANQGCISAQFNLGHMYRNGTGTRQNMQKALEWFEKAANGGDTESQFMAAEMYGAGYGVPQNKIKAYMWYKIAFDTMEARFKNIAKAEMDLLKQEMTAEEVVQAEQLAEQWHKRANARLP